MAESVYKVIELIGTSKDSWEKAAAAEAELKETRPVLPSAFFVLNLAPLAGRGRREAPGEGASPRTRLSNLLKRPLTPTFSPQAGRRRLPASVRDQRAAALVERTE